MLVFSYSLTYASNDLGVIFDLGGGIFSPFLSYIFPIVWAWHYEKKTNQGKKRSMFVYVMDVLTLVFGVVVGIFANYFGFKEAFSHE